MAGPPRPPVGNEAFEDDVDRVGDAGQGGECVIRTGCRGRVHGQTEQQGEEDDGAVFGAQVLGGPPRGGPASGDTLQRGGRGAPVAVTGMSWSGFRPSDDRCTYGYPTRWPRSPCNGLAELASAAGRAALAAEASALPTELTTAVRAHNTMAHQEGRVYAYEVDGLLEPSPGTWTPEFHAARVILRVAAGCCSNWIGLR
ncbi:glycoside hydrolase family 125 protein [Kitasatospora paranensis]|uniref:Glycoside hydrolase family 125 protein n=1 Tax=Kitasatospora paranensis TaxID=258053 RepID=A0ABW2FXN4_9ACTN